MRELHHDAVGLLIGASERFDPPAGSGESKQFRPAHRLDNGAWAIGDPPGLWPLAGLPMLLALDKSAIVVITEGGKCRNRAEAIGFAATHGAHGSAGAEITDFAPLAGRIIWILADSDTPGRTYAQAVAGKLLALGCKVKIIDLFPDRTDGSDIVEFDAQVAGDPRATKSAIEAVAADTPWLDSLNVIGGPLLTCLADVEPRAVTWLWSGRIPSGRITLLVGRPGEGKSFVTMDVAARVSTGTPFPDGTPCERGSVLIISGEDDPHDTIRPRLDAHHADVSCIHLLSMVRRIGEDGKPLEIMFTLADVTSLEDALCR
ncbi:MAG: AAA family ATPase, partial [Tepidisphaeraceae bacterium]